MLKTGTKRSLGPNPLLYPEPVLLVGTYDIEGNANLMTAAWGGICSSEPLSLVVSIRPQRWTYKALLERKAFTIGIPSEKMIEAVDYVGIASGRREDKFAKTGLTPIQAEKVDAPYADECPVVLECSLAETFEIGVHTLMIGRIMDVKADEGCLSPVPGKENSELMPDITKITPLIFDSGSRGYYGIGRRIGEAFSVGKKLI